MADWAELNHDLLIEIAEKLGSRESYECFGKVCRSWGASAREGHLKQRIFEGPWLMFPGKDENNRESIELEREFSSITLGIKKIWKIVLPEASKKQCVSCKDWLLVCSLDEIDVFLLHPLSRIQIHLPKLSTLSLYHITGINHFITKAVLTADPSSSKDFIVIIICGLQRRLGFYKSGDTSWTSIDFWDFWQIEDIMYHNNKVYGVDGNGTILTCDIHGTNPTKLVGVFANLPEEEEFVCKKYLVGLPEGKIFIVRRYIHVPEIDDSDTSECSSRTIKFTIYDVNIQDGTWAEVKHLGNKALFLGFNSSFYIECSEFNKCKPNCIYFSEDIWDVYMRSKIILDYYDDDDDPELIGGGRDTGIYDLSDGSIRLFFDDIITSTITPPIWIGPNFLSNF